LTVGTSAVRLDANAESTVISQCLIRNVDPGTLWVGPAGVTIANGFRVMPGETLTVDLGRNEGVYGVSDIASSPVHVLEVGTA
jgi:hypothetical protein